MAEQAALNKRSSAASVLSESIHEIKRYIEKETISKRLLEQKLNNVQTQKNDLIATHHNYVEKSNQSLDSDEQLTYIQRKLDECNDTIDDVYMTLEDLETKMMEQERNKEEIESMNLQKTKQAEELDKMLMQELNDVELVEDTINKMVEIINDTDKNNIEGASEVQLLVKGIESFMEDAIKSWNKIKMLTSDEKILKEVFEREKNMKRLTMQRYSLAFTFMKKHLPESTNSEVKERESVSDTPKESEARLCLEKMKVPTFGGDIRAFARFKADFKAIVEPNYVNIVHQTYVLKENCLSGEAKKLVENMNDIEAIWTRLEEKYGDNIEIVNTIIKDIEKVTFPKNNQDQGLVNLVNTLEKGIQDLEAIKAHKEIDNAYTVKLIETKLPRRVFAKWLEKEDSLEDSIRLSRFEKMYKFLKQERKQTERLIQLKEQTEKENTFNFKDNRKQRLSAAAVTGDKDKESAKSKHNNNCLIHNTNHLTRKCRTFLQKTAKERGQIVKETKGCKLCLSLSHSGKPCPFESEWGPCGVDDCTEHHSRLVHGCGIQGISMFLQNCYKANEKTIENNDALLLIQKSKSDAGELTCFWDNGSTITLISKNFATKRKLKGIPVTYDLVTVGGQISNQNTMMHEINLKDRFGKDHTVKAYQIDDICGEMKATNVQGLMHLFPLTNYEDVKRYGGEIDLLVGMDYAKLHPKQLCEREGAILYSSQFGTGKIIGGNRNLDQDVPEVKPHLKMMAHAQIKNVRVNRNLTGIDFFSAEDLGVKVPSRCNRCKECKDCKFEAHQLSRTEQKELDVIRENLSLDPIQNRWTTKYPYKNDPKILSNNKSQVLTMLYRTEKRLSRSQITAKQYCDQFNDFIERGIFTEISEEEENEYDGPVFYISHHEVYKEDSSSTPVRLVINSSLKFNGLSLNDILMKGPNAMNDLFGIQIRFRTHLYALVGDVKKMYQSIYTTKLEKHLRRVLWRNMETGKPVKTYGIETVTYGDSPASAISSVTMHDTAEIHKSISEEAAKKIQNDAYVDDVATGDDTLEKIDQHKENISRILEKGGFHMKGFVASGDVTEEKKLLLGSGDKGKVLGICWDPTFDEFTVQTRINLSKKKKGARTAPDLSYEEIPQILTIKLTRRILLSIVNSCYDPLGLLSPVTVQMKIELRLLYNKELGLGWDDPVPPDIKERWIRILQLVKRAEDVKYPRCIKPKDAVDNPILVMSNDGSSEAMCATAHVRWQLQSGEFVSHLWSAKTRVTPLQKISIPRIELQSAVMATRLSKAIRTFSELNFSRVIHILDSKCTLALLSKDTMALREFAGNRVAEILESTTVDQWFHVNSAENIADLGTRRNADITDISTESNWQKGPLWMKQEIDQWPVSQNIDTSVPNEELVKGACFSTIQIEMFSFERFRHRTYEFLLRVIARVITILRNKSFTSNSILANDIDIAEKKILGISMRLTRHALETGKLHSLRPQVDEDGLIVTASRAVKGLQKFYSSDRFPILTRKDPVAHLWMKKAHHEDHSGITKTIARARKKYWIIGARRLALKIKRECYRCRLLDKMLAQQLMAPLPMSRLAPTPPFYNTSMDLFGPIEIKDTVKQRSRKKVWGAIFNCAVTRGLYLDVSEDYGTDAILQVIRRFISIRGCPHEILSDQGSQLIAAAKDIAELCKDWDWKPIEEFATSNRIRWTVTPAEGQHQNGLSESLIKSVKRSMKHKICGYTLTFSELQMTFFEIANIINSRPLGIVTGSDPEYPEPITPNHLLLGRASFDVPQGPFDTRKPITKRFSFLQNLVDEWWENWYRTVLPSLVPNYKWLQRHRNVAIDDVCLIRYGKDKRASYRLGRVKEVKKGTDGLVRTIVLNYKLPEENVFRTVERPVQSIAVIVPVEEQTINIDSNKLDNVSMVYSIETKRIDNSILNPLAQDFNP